MGALGLTQLGAAGRSCGSPPPLASFHISIPLSPNSSGSSCSSVDVSGSSSPIGRGDAQPPPPLAAVAPPPKTPPQLATRRRPPVRQRRQGTNSNTIGYTTTHPRVSANHALMLPISHTQFKLCRARFPNSVTIACPIVIESYLIGFSQITQIFHEPISPALDYARTVGATLGKLRQFELQCELHTAVCER